MADPILADARRHTTTREAIRQAILQRTTRGMLTYNTGKVHHLEGELWAVPSTRGGFYQVNLEHEGCDCEDWTFFGSEHDVACRHIVAAAIASEKRARMQRHTLRYLEDQLAHEDMDIEARAELEDRVLKLRRRLSR